MRPMIGTVALCIAGLAPTLAGAVDASPRPEIRNSSAKAVISTRSDLETSVRPKIRPASKAAIDAENPPVTNQRFQNWIGAFSLRAEAQGIAPAVIERAMQGVRYDADVIRRDRNQSEFTKTIWEYLDSAVSDMRVTNGQSALRDHAATLQTIEDRYGVEKEVVAAVWGLESAYGRFRGNSKVIHSLATLAFDGRRGAFFEEQLIAALRILQSGDTVPENMTGSWAGAMGHTQFMPTSYLEYAVDFTGDGRRDIWSDDPADALASTAAYLKHFGWTTGQPWGVEVRIPEGFDYTQAKRSVTKLPTAWALEGVLDVSGQPVTDYGEAAVLLPAGGNGAAFLIFQNFGVIERYNSADAYVIGVGHLSDRIAGKPAIQASWPREDRALTLKERKELQTRLTERGFDTQGVDGKIGPLTIEAVRSFQVASGLKPDGYASLNILKQLR